MQLEEAQRLQREWKGRHCDHPSTEKEYFNGSDTGDHVCSICGKAIYDANGKIIEPDNHLK
jgi:hypothetical protein